LPDEAVDAKDERAATMPVFVQHGSDDQMVNVDRARESRDRLNAIGVQPDYREYPMGHEIRPDSLRDLSDWIERTLGLAAPIEG
jgi:phospholipase/carboxylesterase